MDIDTLARLIHGLRCANLVLWLWIGMGSVAPIRRILGRTTVQGDWLGGTLFLLAASLITFQILDRLEQGHRHDRGAGLRAGAVEADLLQKQVDLQ